MGTAYETLVGPPPEVRKYEWHHWYSRLLERRIAECNKARATTYYFAQAGNDTTGNGTIGNPYKTIAKAQALIDASSGNIACLFKRGDEWRETVGIYSSKLNVTIGDYGTALGTGAKPFFNRFTIDYLDAANPWTLAAGNRYTLAETTTVAWVREKNDRLNPYTKVASASEVEATPRSWYWAANVLHINAGTGVDPNTRDFEAVVANGDTGVELAGDGGLIKNIRADGWGMDLANTNNQKHGIKASPNGTDAVLVVGCESYYTSAHCMAYYGGGTVSNSGGIATFIDCVAGFPLQNASGETVFNSYVYGGDQETIFHNCRTQYGTLPEGTAAYSSRGTSVYQHTNGDGTPSALYIVYGHQTLASDWPVNVGVNGVNCQTASQLSDCRAFNIFETQEFAPVGQTNGSTRHIAQQNIANVNCVWRVKPKQLTTGALAASTQTGWAINCLLDVDMVNQTSRIGVWNTSGDTNTMKLWHCLFYIRGNKSTPFSLDYDAYGGVSSFCTGAELKNSIVLLKDPGGANYVAFNGDGTKMVANAYSIDSFTDSTTVRRYGMDTAHVEVSSADEFEITEPASPSPLYQNGITTLGVEYDVRMRPRDPSAPTIGPFEPWVASIPASDMVATINGAVSTINTYLTDGRVKLSPVDGISDQSMREALLAYIAGKSAVVDNGNGTKTITYRKQDGTTAKLAITFNTSGEFIATMVG